MWARHDFAGARIDEYGALSKNKDPCMFEGLDDEIKVGRTSVT